MKLCSDKPVSKFAFECNLRRYDVVQYDDVCTLDNGSLVLSPVFDTACASYTQVPRADSWITEEQFFAGLAIVQAMPGPLFNLSAYIGALAARRAGANIMAGIAAAWFGLFGPGVMLIYGGGLYKPSRAGRRRHWVWVIRFGHEEIIGRQSLAR